MKVNWNDKICIHAGECVKNLPNVFKIVDKKFVIDKSAASEDEIKRSEVEIQEITDSHVKTLNEIMESKEKEIMIV